MMHKEKKKKVRRITQAICHRCPTSANVRSNMISVYTVSSIKVRPFFPIFHSFLSRSLMILLFYVNIKKQNKTLNFIRRFPFCSTFYSHLFYGWKTMEVQINCEHKSQHTRMLWLLARTTCESRVYFFFFFFVRLC